MCTVSMCIEILSAVECVLFVFLSAVLMKINPIFSYEIFFVSFLLFVNEFLYFIYVDGQILYFSWPNEFQLRIEFF